MSLHPSLRVDQAATQQRTVLTRIERIKDLMKRELWQEGQAVTGLPKTKILKIKTRKKTKEQKEEEAAAAAAAGTGTAAAAPKAAAPKAGEKAKS